MHTVKYADANIENIIRKKKDKQTQVNVKTDD